MRSSLGDASLLVSGLAFGLAREPILGHRLARDCHTWLEHYSRQKQAFYLLLSSNNRRVRLIATRVAGKLPDPGLDAALVRNTKDRWDYVRKAAWEALNERDSPTRLFGRQFK